MNRCEERIFELEQNTGELLQENEKFAKELNSISNSKTDDFKAVINLTNQQKKLEAKNAELVKMVEQQAKTIKK